MFVRKPNQSHWSGTGIRPRRKILKLLRRQYRFRFYYVFRNMKNLLISLLFCYTLALMENEDSSIRRTCGPRFAEIFRAILYDPRLTWGAKCLAFAILDLPVSTKIVNAKLARKLKSNPAQITVWRQELEDHQILLPVKK